MENYGKACTTAAGVVPPTMCRSVVFRCWLATIMMIRGGRTIEPEKGEGLLALLFFINVSHSHH
jgi:hypothetical protein